MTKQRLTRLVVIALIALLTYCFLAYDLGRFLTLAYLKNRQQAFLDVYASHPVMTPAVYMGIYILTTALSLPGAVVLTLAGGALFGLFTGVVLVSFASTIGATLAFLASRLLLRDFVQKRFGDKLAAVNKGIDRDGELYLFTLRLVPLFPFFVINLVMGLTSIRVARFYAVSQLGMLAGTIVYVNAGTQLAGIDSLQGILSPGLLLSFALLGIFPIGAKKLAALLKTRRTLGRYSKPPRFDYNLVVIGAGSAGLVTAYIAAAVRAEVALIEKHRMGGDCLHTGCVPSKALIRSARILSLGRRAREFGLESIQLEFDFAKVMERVREVIRKIEPHDSVERYTGLGVRVFEGEARVLTPYEVEVDGRRLTTRNIVIATGARPVVPPIKGIEQIPYLTSDNLWEIRELPRRLIVLGGGPIGCELTQAFARFGSRVTQVEMTPRILPREDPEISDLMLQRFASEDIRVLTGHRALEVLVDKGRKILVCDHRGGLVRLEFDEILIAVGRIANTSGFGLEELGITVARNGALETDPFLRTNFPNIYCAGDVTGPYQFTHAAAHQAWYAAVNSLFGGLKRFPVDYRVIPWCTFTDPEVARVGINETEAREKGIPHEVTRYGLEDLDRAIADAEDRGLVKVLTPPGKDKIVGVTIVGPHAGDLLAEYVLAMKHGLGLNKILGTIHIYPTLAEANKYAAGAWKKAHAPEKLLRWVEKYHAWRRT
ncbi:MAG: FAD-dependent oxidoreductase [Thermodesulfobacteriota bacterium]